MPSSRSHRQHLRLGVTGPQGVLRLQRGDRMNRVRPADRAGPGRGQPDVADLALSDQFGHRADGVLDRCSWIDTVLVVQVDVVGAKPPERTFDRDADVCRATVQAAGAAGVREAAILGGQHNLVTAALNGPADEFLVDERPVGLGGVDKGDA